MKKQPPPQPPADRGALPAGPDHQRLSERMMADLHRLIAAKNFQSAEEVNAFLEALMRSDTPIDELAPPRPDTPLERAQEVMDQAYQAKGKRQRVALARKALEISADCVEAYLMLARESATTVAKATAYYTDALAAAERTLNPALFEQGAGHFWGIPETRPYMRARAGLAEGLIMSGYREEGMAHLRELLRLNADDNLGIRYLLLGLLIEAGAYDQATALLAQYKNERSTAWLYNRALLFWLQEGSTQRSRKALNEAIRYNPYVAEFAMGETELPEGFSGQLWPGADDEAMDYHDQWGHLWQAVRVSGKGTRKAGDNETSKALMWMVLAALKMRD
jgi:tetratricopeptide (TPR) repeat protein